MNVFEAAQRYLERGWCVIPVPHRSKKPVIKGWQTLRIRADELTSHFNGQPTNIGILLGEPSNWTIDIDLDHPRCIELAESLLPQTPAIFGRPGKPRSHRIYRVTRPAATFKCRSKSAGMLVEFRSTGTQTIVPPSIHESGEAITWEDEDAEPALVDPDELASAVRRLTDAVLVEIGEKAAKRPMPTTTRNERSTKDTTPVDSKPSKAPRQAPEQCLQAMQRMGIVDHRDGSLRLFAAACRCVEHGLNDAQALDTIRRYEALKPFPATLSDDQVLKRIRDAEKVCKRGSALTEPLRDVEGRIVLGSRDPSSGRLILSPRRTLPSAQAFLRDFHAHPERTTLINHADVFLIWRGNRYTPVEDGALRARMHPWLHETLRYALNSRSKEFELQPFEANPAAVTNVLETLKSATHLPADTAMPSWLDEDAQLPSPVEILPCRSSLLHLPTGRTLPLTPLYFNCNGLDFDHDPNAPAPHTWQHFLGQLFEEDYQSWDLLQEWFGYCLTGDTSQQKMLLVVGPKRSGKGTLARVLTRLVGPSNVCGPTISSLAGPFGLQPLIGKSLAIISDARFSGKDIQTVVERMLCISGEDTLTIDRKHIPSVTMKLPTRMVFLTNELPRLTDASGALPGRFLILRLTRSFYGEENTRLTDQLITELPGILNWAVKGWHRLHNRGCFVQPASVEGVLQDLEDLSSPVNAFVRDCCEVDPNHRVYIDKLYHAWKNWCEADGRVSVTSKQVFGRDLVAAVPEVSRHQDGYGRFYRGIELR